MRGGGRIHRVLAIAAFELVSLSQNQPCSLKSSMKSPNISAIELFTSAHELSEITNPRSRERLAHTLSTLDATLLTEEEIRNCFAGIRVAMAAFITKVNILEDGLVQIKKDQIASEARLEAMCLRARDEVRELRLEINELRLNKKQSREVLQLARKLHGDLFSGGGDPFSLALQASKLPSNFTTRLEFAQQNGFKWNQNNRIPTKPTKQIKVLEEWENQFCAVESMSIGQVLDKSYVVKAGPGAIAGALMLLERELGALLPERKTHSIFNCYQKAIKLFQEKQHPQPSILQQSFDIKSIVLATFYHLPQEDIDNVENRLKTRVLDTPEQVVSAIKKLVSKSSLPAFIVWQDKDNSDTERLYSLQSGDYDSQLTKFIKKYELTHLN